jgi:8-oxo-dGTP diphosphatase
MSELKLAVDAVVFGYNDAGLHVLLIKRGIEPFKDIWAIPGGFAQVDETLEETVKRELNEEAGITNVFLEQLYTFSDISRDPRGRVISAAYYCLVSPKEHRIKASTDAKDVAWFPIKELPELAFDHKDIIKVAFERLKGKIKYQPVGFELMPNKFTIKELRLLYETIWERPLERSNFQKRIKTLDLVKEVASGDHKNSTKIFSFNKKVYKKFNKDGFYFEI